MIDPRFAFCCSWNIICTRSQHEQHEPVKSNVFSALICLAFCSLNFGYNGIRFNVSGNFSYESFGTLPDLMELGECFREERVAHVSGVVENLDVLLKVEGI